MIKRELYMSRIRPFIGTELVKVMTGIRRCGKSVMLELIKQELTESGVSPTQFVSINFEDMSYSHLQTAQALHDEITKRAKEIGGKVYLFFDEIQEVKDWEKCINSLRVSLDCDIYITGSNAKLLSGELATYLGGRYVEFVIYPFSFGEFMELYTACAFCADISSDSERTIACTPCRTSLSGTPHTTARSCASFKSRSSHPHHPRMISNI